MIKLKKILTEETSYGKKNLQENRVVIELLARLVVAFLPAILSVGRNIVGSAGRGLASLVGKVAGTFSPEVKAQIQRAKNAMEKEEGDDEAAMARMAVQDYLQELSKDQELIKLLKVLEENPYIHYMKTRSDKDIRSQDLRRTANTKIGVLLKTKYPELAAKLEQYGKQSLSKFTDLLPGQE
jgi:hypothetical protein